MTPPNLHGLQHHRFLSCSSYMTIPVGYGSAWCPRPSGTQADRAASCETLLVSWQRRKDGGTRWFFKLLLRIENWRVPRVSSPHTSLAKANHMARPDVSGVAHLTIPPPLAVGEGQWAFWTLQFTTWYNEHSCTPPPPSLCVYAWG